MKDALSILNKNQQTDFVGLPKYSLYVFIILVMLLHFNAFLKQNNYVGKDTCKTVWTNIFGSILTWKGWWKLSTYLKYVHFSCHKGLHLPLSTLLWNVTQFQTVVCFVKQVRDVTSYIKFGCYR